MKFTSCSTQLVADQVRAFRTWDRDANLPDVLERADFRARPDLVSDTLHRRRAETRGPQPVLVLPYPKDDGTQRTTCLLDPFDDVLYALAVSAIAPAVERALPGSDVVLSIRFVPSRQVFRSEGWRDARKRKGGNVDRKSKSGVGGFDVKDHFGSIAFDSLRRTLYSCGVPDGACEDLIGFLESLGRWPSSPNGIPAGPMASALLGTVALLPLDRVLSRSGRAYERWVDDVVVEVPTEAQFVVLRQEVDRVLSLNSQVLNSSKTWYEERTEPSGGSIGDFDERLDSDEAAPPSLDALRDAVELGDAQRCRFVLGGLTARDDDRAVGFVAENPRLWEMAPTYAGDYLLRTRASLTDDHLEAMVDRCATQPSQGSAAGVAHSARVLAKRRVPRSLGPLLHDAADRLSSGPYRGAAPFLYHSASVSKEKPRVRCERSIDTACALTDVNTARGLVAGLKFDSNSRRIAEGLRALASCRPDLAPTAAWVGT